MKITKVWLAPPGASLFLVAQQEDSPGTARAATDPMAGRQSIHEGEGRARTAVVFRQAAFGRRDGVLCATCHHPKFAFTDGSAVSTGIKGQKGGRSAPTVFNRAYSLAQFWDGRAATLEDQAKGPMANPIEMGNTHEAHRDEAQ